MGCFGAEVVDPEITKILASLDTKMEDYEKTFIKNVEDVKKKQKEQLENRHDELSKLKEKKEEITEEKIKKLNEDELKVEVKFLENAVNKMHYIFSTGLELVEPIRKITLNNLLEKAKSAPAMTINTINKQIEEVKKISAIEFLDSTYGKVLKEALEKKGISIILKGTRKSIFKERQERRKLEREEFGIKVNEFDDEKIDDIKLDLGSLIFGDSDDDKEFLEELNKNYKDYCREKRN